MEDIFTKNFMRHLHRNHATEDEVEKILQLPKNSKERRKAVFLLRNDTNFDLFINGNIRPNRVCFKKSEKNSIYFPCAFCKGLFIKEYLRRHAKKCVAQKSFTNDGHKKNI